MAYTGRNCVGGAAGTGNWLLPGKTSLEDRRRATFRGKVVSRHPPETGRSPGLNDPGEKGGYVTLFWFSVKWNSPFLNMGLKSGALPHKR